MPEPYSFSWWTLFLLWTFQGPRAIFWCSSLVTKNLSTIFGFGRPTFRSILGRGKVKSLPYPGLAQVMARGIEYRCVRSHLRDYAWSPRHVRRWKFKKNFWVLLVSVLTSTTLFTSGFFTRAVTEGESMATDSIVVDADEQYLNSGPISEAYGPEIRHVILKEPERILWYPMLRVAVLPITASCQLQLMVRSVGLPGDATLWSSLFLLWIETSIGQPPGD